MIVCVYWSFINCISKYNSCTWISLNILMRFSNCLRCLSHFCLFCLYFPIYFTTHAKSWNIYEINAVFTQGTIVRGPNGANGSGSSTNANNPNGIEKTRTPHSNDIPSSNLPGWSVYNYNRCASNGVDAIILLLCLVLVTSIQLN